MANVQKNLKLENTDSNVMFKRHVVRKGNKRKVRPDNDSSEESDPETQARQGIKQNKLNLPVLAASFTDMKASFNQESTTTKSTDFPAVHPNTDDAIKQSH